MLVVLWKFCIWFCELLHFRLELGDFILESFHFSFSCCKLLFIPSVVLHHSLSLFLPEWESFFSPSSFKEIPRVFLLLSTVFRLILLSVNISYRKIANETWLMKSMTSHSLDCKHLAVWNLVFFLCCGILNLILFWNDLKVVFKWGIASEPRSWATTLLFTSKYLIKLLVLSKTWVFLSFSIYIFLNGYLNAFVVFEFSSFLTSVVSSKWLRIWLFRAEWKVPGPSVWGSLLRAVLKHVLCSWQVLSLGHLLLKAELVCPGSSGWISIGSLLKS